MKVRLLICKDCHSIEELPNFTGPPEYDVLLEGLVQNHRFPNGEEHVGSLAVVEKEEWDNPTYKEAITKKITEQFSGGTTGFESEFYASKNTYQADAMECYNQHRRPESCIDYKDSSKRIGNPSKMGWETGPRVYLCQFCPYETVVITEKRHKRGMYKEN